MIIRDTASKRELFRLTFDVTITEAKCEELTIIHDSASGAEVSDMEIVVETDADGNPLDGAARVGLTAEQPLPAIVDAAGLLEEGYCSEVYYRAFVDGYPVEWLKAEDGQLVLGEPEDSGNIGAHNSELKLMFPASLVQSGDLQLRSLGVATTSVDLGAAETTDLSPWTDIVLDSISFKVTVKLAEVFTSVTPEPEVQLAF